MQTNKTPIMIQLSMTRSWARHPLIYGLCLASHIIKFYTYYYNIPNLFIKMLSIE